MKSREELRPIWDEIKESVMTPISIRDKYEPTSHQQMLRNKFGEPDSFLTSSLESMQTMTEAIDQTTAQKFTDEERGINIT